MDRGVRPVDLRTIALCSGSERCARSFSGTAANFFPSSSFRTPAGAEDRTAAAGPPCGLLQAAVGVPQPVAAVHAAASGGSESEQLCTHRFPAAGWQDLSLHR